ncbi:MAG: WD40 repeat domain-containing protein [Promethearchaeota archaeon]
MYPLMREAIGICCIPTGKEYLKQGCLLVKDTVSSEEGHQGGINAIAVDNTYIYSVGDDGTLIIWDKASLAKKQTIPISNVSLLSLALGPHSICIGGSYDKSVITILDKFDLSESAVLGEHSSSIFDLRVSDDILLSGSADDEIILWSTEDWSKRDSVAVGQHIVQSVEMDADHVYVGGIGDFVGIYRLRDLELITKLVGHEADVFSLAVDDQFIYSGSGEVWWGGPGSPRPSTFESAIRVWDKKNWECIAVLEGHSDNVNDISVDERSVYSVSDDGTLRQYHKSDWLEGEVIDLKARALNAITSDKGNLFIGGTSGRVVRISK